MCCKERGNCDCQGDSCCGDACQCGCEGGFRRRYQTKAEKIAELEAYLVDLKSEIQAVEERMVDLRK